MGMIIQYESGNLDKYLLELKTIASFSKLFSESNSPYIHSRSAENIYCESFNALNVSRADCTADAIYGKTGVGIKTFTGSNLQKIAEFNGLRPEYEKLHGLDLAKKISFFRNNRIDVTMRTYGLDRMIYHYSYRESGKVKIFEEEMNKVDIDNIVLLEETNKKILFSDGKEIYEFMISKSTLYKKFNLDAFFAEFSVDIIENPLDGLLKILDSENSKFKLYSKSFVTIPSKETLIIPLYTEDRYGNRRVCEKSGLNQWNASGRKRNPNEVYINFPANIRRENPDFFPSRDVKWELKLPNGKWILMKICQGNDKAIMSDPNKDLGKWLLRDVLNLPEGKLLTYDYLLEVGINSVIFKKDADGKYFIDFISVED